MEKRKNRTNYKNNWSEYKINEKITTWDFYNKYPQLKEKSKLKKILEKETGKFIKIKGEKI